MDFFDEGIFAVTLKDFLSSFYPDLLPPTEMYRKRGDYTYTHTHTYTFLFK